MKKQLLKAKIIEKGFTSGKIAEELGINEATFSRKMNGKSIFTVSELKKLIEILKLTPEEILSIFFSN